MQPPRRSARSHLAVAAAAMAALAASAAQGITINLVFNAGASANPAGDPAGANLTAIMNQVKSVYEDIFEDTHTITITYWYENLAAGTLAGHSLTSQSGGRETAGSIRFDPDASGTNWFWDPTPADNSEFSMQQTLWRDLTPTNQTNWYNAGANIPATFEAAYTGADNGTNLNVAGNTDLLSVALHETGHSLGMSAANTSTVNETNDGDYDYSAVNVFGCTLAARVASGGNIAHLASWEALMTPAIGTGIRRLPSHTDLFCMAKVHNYNSLDVPRREFYGGGDWNTAANWSGNAVPGSLDEVHVRNPGSIVTMGLSGAGYARELSIGEGAWVSTNAFGLYVSSATIDGSGASVSTRLRVQSGGTLSAGSILATNTGTLNLLGGLASAGTITTTTTGVIYGQGTVTISGYLSNSGTISAYGGTLAINTSGSGSLGLDGPGTPPFLFEPGTVNAVDGDIVVNGTMSEEFNGAMNVGAGHLLEMAHAWTLGAPSGTLMIGSRGQLNLSGSLDGTSAATLNGATITVEGDIAASGYAVINPDQVFQAGSSVTVSAGGTLELNRMRLITGGSFGGDGQIVLGADAADANTTVTGNLTISVADFDWDGGYLGDTFTVANSASVTITSTISDSYSEALNIGGALAVNSPAPWSIDGIGAITFNTGTLSGSQVSISGYVSAIGGGTSEISNPATFTSFSTIDVAAGSSLALTGSVSFGGGTITGSGILRFDGNQVFSASTTVGVATLDMDGLAPYGTMTVNSGVTVTIDSSSIEADPTGGFGGNIVLNSGRLIVNTSAPWEMAGLLQLNDVGGGKPNLAGQTMFLHGGTITSSGGSLISAPLWSGGGTITTLAGTLDVIGLFSSTGGTLTKNGPGLLRILGGQSHGVSTLDINAGTLLMASDAGGGGANLAVNANAIFILSSTQRLAALNIGPAGLVVLAPGGNKVLVTQGLTIEGSPTSGELNLTDEDMIWDYAGASPYSDVRFYLRIGLNGGNWMGRGIRSSTAAGMTMTGLGYAEAAALGLAVFDGQPVDATSVLVKYTWYGDTNLDGQVDVVDLGNLATGWQMRGDWINGDSDYSGFIDVIDLGLLATNWQAGAGSPLEPGSLAEALAAFGLPAASVPEPAAALGMALPALLRRRRATTPLQMRLAGVGHPVSPSASSLTQNRELQRSYITTWEAAVEGTSPGRPKAVFEGT